MTLPDTVAGWTSYGFSIKQAVHDLIALHLARQNAKGSGNKARRRAEVIRHRVFSEIIAKLPPTVYDDLNENGQRWEGGRGWVTPGHWIPWDQR